MMVHFAIYASLADYQGNSNKEGQLILNLSQYFFGPKSCINILHNSNFFLSEMQMIYQSFHTSFHHDVILRKKMKKWV